MKNLPLFLLALVSIGPVALPAIAETHMTPVMRPETPEETATREAREAADRALQAQRDAEYKSQKAAYDAAKKAKEDVVEAQRAKALKELADAAAARQKVLDDMKKLRAAKITPDCDLLEDSPAVESIEGTALTSGCVIKFVNPSPVGLSCYVVGKEKSRPPVKTQVNTLSHHTVRISSNLTVPVDLVCFEK